MLKSFTLALFALLGLDARAQDYKSGHLIVGCSILDMRGNHLKTFPGRVCQFFENGSYITGIRQTLRFVNKSDAVLWELPTVAHHTLNLSADKKRILVLDRVDFKSGEKILKEDLFRILDRDGKTLAESPAHVLMSQLKSLGIKYSDQDLTHFNSFYEIPELGPGLELPDYVKPGNLILNARFLGIFFVSGDLKKILHFLPMKSSVKNNIHDVQVTSAGKLFYFNNRVATEKGDEYFSSVEEFDFASQKSQNLFEASPREIFFSPDGGGAQRLDKEHLLFSHQLTGSYVYSLKDKKILMSITKTHSPAGESFPLQTAKAENLTSFLKFRK